MHKLRDLKKRIKTVSEIGHMAKSMKTLATSKIKPAEDKMNRSIIYENRISGIMKNILIQAAPDSSYLFRERPAKKYALVVLTPDAGFCGAFTHNILHAALDFTEYHNQGRDLLIIALGLKAISAFKRRKYPLEMAVPKWEASITTSKVVLERCLDLYNSRKVDKVLVLYSKPALGLRHQAYREVLIPLPHEDKPRSKEKDYLIDPSPEETLELVLPHFLLTKLYRMLCETRAGELSARVRSMTSASENAEKLKHMLTLQYYRARQESITKEIIELTGSKEANH